MGRYINPLLDFSFKRLFGQDASKELLIDFLNILLEGERKVEDITFYFFDRALFYLCRMISSQGQKGGDWTFEVCPVYGIYFLNFRLPGLNKLRTDVILADRDTGLQIDGRLRQIFISLPHFELTADECQTDFERWIYLFKYMDTLERIPFETKKATFRKLLKAAEIESLSSGDRRHYDKVLKDYRDYVNTVEYAKVEGIEIGMEKGKVKGIEIGMEKGKVKGIEIGMEKGKAEGVKTVALRLKESDVSLDLIIRSTGLSPEDIEKL
ncbi:Rpn family recombination-promoting nuclease/putative transposase [Parabacteroides sp. PF5-6]|uniref:Rpn family recombination-promoting nuclease/putative transposase n=1 Tax=Parabacteroides sp. PF5-6 TaxID=1742403 RepID=UPI002406C70D|nr:Rpn family recombination-promoting nuclease/putative transposase [Parabacteroides sp. PF5-6]MDF9831222.1 putative transposase/invertase (TIGR01784 family) [Parabacteroides sp. PF5-6]